MTMTRDDAVALVRRGLDFRRSSISGDDDIIEALQEAQRQREMGTTLPWFLKTEQGTFTGTASVNYIALPTGFLRFDEECALAYYNADGAYVRDLELGEYSHLNKLWASSTLTSSYAASLRNTRLYVFPTPNAAFSIKTDYYAAATELTDNVTNEWLTYAPDILICDAGLIMAADLQATAAATKFATKLARAETKLLAETVEREGNGRTYAMGSNI